MKVTMHTAEAAGQYVDDVLRVWNATFGAVDDVDRWRTEVWDRHRRRADYRLATAHENGRLVGFSWGYTGQRGQFWSNLVVDKLGAAVEDWVGGHFEFVELAVLSQSRGRGIGGQLHDRLLMGLQNRRAMLSTSADPADPAVRLYASRGWQRLGLLSPQTQVMGKLLLPDPMV